METKTKIPMFIRIKEERYRINTIKRYAIRNGDLFFQFNTSRYKIESETIRNITEEELSSIINKLDFYLL